MSEGYVDAGRLEVQVVADLRGFTRSLKTKLAAETRGTSATVRVGVDVNSRGMRTALRAAAKEAGAIPVTVEARLSKTQLRKLLSDAVPRGGVEVPIKPTVDPRARREAAADIDALNAKLQRALIGSERAALAAESAHHKLAKAERDGARDSEAYRRAELGVADAENRRADAIGRARKALEELQKGARKNATINVDADVAVAEARIKAAARNRTVKLKVDADARPALTKLGALSKIITDKLAPGASASSKSFGLLGNTLGLIGKAGTPLLFAGLAAGAVGAAGAAGSLLAGLGPVVNTLGLIPAAAAGAGAALATVMVGMNGIGAALKAAGAKDLDKYNAALAKLSPSAQTAVKAFVTLQPTLHKFQQTVQEALFKNTGASIMRLATTYLGPGSALRQAIAGTAAAFNTGFRASAGYLTLASTISSIHAGLTGITATSNQLARTARPLTSIFVTLWAAAAPFITRVAGGVADVAERMAMFLATTRRTGQLSAFFQSGLTVARQLGRIVGDLTAGLFGFFRAGTGAGQGFLDSLESVLSAFRAFTSSAEGQNKIRAFFADTATVLRGFKDTVIVLGQAIGDAMSLFHRLPDSAKGAAGPVLLIAAALAKVTGAGGGLAKGVGSLIDQVNKLATASAQNRAADKMVGAAAAQNRAADKMVAAAAGQDAAAAEGGAAGLASKGGKLAKVAGAVGISAGALEIGALVAAALAVPAVLAAGVIYAEKQGWISHKDRTTGTGANKRTFDSQGRQIGGPPQNNGANLRPATGPGSGGRAGGTRTNAFETPYDPARAAGIAAARRTTVLDPKALQSRIDAAEKALSNPQLKLSKPAVIELKANIQDWQAKKLQVQHEALRLSENPTVMDITGDISHIERGIGQVRSLLTDKKLTDSQRLTLTADLTQLYRDRAEAQGILDIKTKKVTIQANIDALQVQIRAAQDTLNGLPPEQRVVLQAKIDDYERQLAAARGDLDADWVVNKHVIDIQARITSAQDKIAALQAELKTKIPQDRRIAINADISKLRAGIDLGVKDLATLPEFATTAGTDVGTSFGLALDAMAPQVKLRGLKLALAAAEGLSAFNAKYLAKPGNFSSANAAEHAAEQLQQQQSQSVTRIKAQIAQAEADAKAADAAGGRITGDTSGYKSKTKQASDKAAASQARATARAQANAAAAAARAAATKAHNAAVAAGKYISRGFTAGITGSLPGIQAASYKMADYLRTALGASAGGITALLATDTIKLQALARTRDGIITQLTAAQKKLADLKAKSAQTAADVATQVKNSFTLVDTGGAATVAGITDRLTKAVAAAQEFAKNITAIRAKGLNADLLQQLATAGPTAGAGTATALASATDAQIGQINKLSGALSATATKTGSSVADALYGSGLDAAQGLVNGLLAKKADADAAMVALADTLTGAIRRALGIKSPSKVTAGLGGDIGDGLNVGLAATAGTLQTTATTMMTALTATFAAGVQSIAAAWGGIRAAARSPVKFVIDTVINGGLLGAYNAIAKQFGVAQVPPFKTPKGFATGGIYPGYSPGRDTGVIAVGGGEAIIRPEGTRALGAEWVDGINAAARSGGVAGARKFLGAFASGGLVPALTAFARQSGVPFNVTSGLRDTSDYHGRGMAIDMASSAGNMVRLASWLYARYRNLLELIHSGGAGYFVKNGQRVSPSYYQSVLAEHLNHVHLAMNAAGLAAAGAPGAATATDAAGPVGAALAKAIGKVGTSPFAGVVKAAAQAVAGVLTGPGAAALGGAGITASLSADLAGSPALAGLPAGVTRWAPIVQQVLAALHVDGSYLGAALRRIKFESGGNPTAINLTDSNARAGHPSQGLMQTIPATFAHWAGPYVARGITDPLANIYAGLNYALHRYGSINAIDPLVRPYGYDAGGVLPPGTSLVHNGTRRPEAILTGGQFDRLIGALAGLAGQLHGTQLQTAGRISFSRVSAGAGPAAAAPGGPGVTVNVHPRQGQSEREIGRIAAREIEWARGAAW